MRWGWCRMVAAALAVAVPLANAVDAWAQARPKLDIVVFGAPSLGAFLTPAIKARILFIMVATTLATFSFQMLDAYRAMSKDLLEMTLTFRPKRRDLFRVLILPTIIPGILTAWKVNLGNAARVVVVAELVGATGGIGYQLLQQQQLFDMAGAIAWTLVLVVFVLVVQQIITVIEGWLLAWRPSAERAV